MTSLYVSGALLHGLASSLTLPLHLAEFTMFAYPTVFDSKKDRERLVLAYTFTNKACAVFIALSSVGIWLASCKLASTLPSGTKTRPHRDVGCGPECDSGPGGSRLRLPGRRGTR